jgi:hypothetical protein
MSKDKKTPSNPEEIIQQTLEKNKSLANKAFDLLAEVVLDLPKRKPKNEVIAPLSDLQRKQLSEIQENAIAGFTGQLDELESALGMLAMGHHFGWKVLYLIHSKKTVRKYEDILGIKIRDIFPEKGPSSYRSYGLNLAEKIGNFWKVAGGDIKIPDRRKVDYEDK